jgi:hypothetical protein
MIPLTSTHKMAAMLHKDLLDFLFVIGH